MKKTTEAHPTEAAAAVEENISKIRAVVLPESSGIPRLAKGVLTLTPEEKRVLLNIAEENRAEAVAGLREIVTRLAKNPNELGDLGPSPRLAAAAGDRLERLGALRLEVGALAAMLETVDEVAQHDARRLLGEAKSEVLRRTEKGLLTEADYHALRRYLDAEGRAISDGIAAAKAEKAAKPA